jgi:hypothetical protein
MTAMYRFVLGQMALAVLRLIFTLTVKDFRYPDTVPRGTLPHIHCAKAIKLRITRVLGYIVLGFTKREIILGDNFLT